MKKRFYVIATFLLSLMVITLGACSNQQESNSDAPMQNSQITIEESSDKETALEDAPSIETKQASKDTLSDSADEISGAKEVLTEEIEDIVPEEFVSNETELAVQNLYDIVVSYDEATHIQRTTWDFGEYEHELWYEIPIFPQNGIGYNEINGFFDTLLQEFIVYQDTEYSGLTSILAQIAEPMYNETFYNINSIDIFLESEFCIGVKMRYEWYMGGVTDYGSNMYYFDTQSGEMLTLLDFLVESEVEVKEMLVCELQNLTENPENIYWDIVEHYPIDELNFQIYDGNLLVSFDKYEIAAGVMGGIGITLPATLNETYGQALANMEDLT